MTRGSRANLMTRASARLQGAFERRRKDAQARVERLREQGAFRAPDHLAPGLQASLGLAGALELDAARSEAG